MSNGCQVCIYELLLCWSKTPSLFEMPNIKAISLFSSSLFLSLLLSGSVNLPGWFVSVLSSRTVCMCLYLVCIGGQSHGLCQFSLHWENMLLDRWNKKGGGAVKQTQGQQIQDLSFLKSTTIITNPPDWETKASKMLLLLFHDCNIHTCRGAVTGETTV